MVNLADVARQAHVSQMTVSRVINHPNQVSDEVRDLVNQAIKAVGYQPNRIAKALVNQQNYVIQFIVLEDIATVEPNYAILLLKIAEVLNQKGYTLEISTILEPNSHVDGLIVSGWRNSDLERLSAINVPMVLYGQAPTWYDLPYVDVNNRMGTSLATTHLIEAGYKKVIYIGMTMALPFVWEREQGYLETMAKHHLVSRTYDVSNHSHDAEKLIQNIIANLPKNTGIVCATDRIALGVVRALKAQSQIPENYGVVGFDGVFIDQITSPKLTTIKQPFWQLANTLVSNLLNQLHHSELKTELIQPRLVKRDSTRQV